MDKERPFKSPYFRVEVLEYLNNLILVHFGVQRAKVSITLGRLPTLVMLALVNPSHVGLVLSEIEILARMNLSTNALVEVIVRYFTVTVVVKSVKDHSELLR